MKSNEEVIQEALAAKKNQVKPEEDNAIAAVQNKFPDAAYIGDFKFTLGGYTFEFYDSTGCLCTHDDEGWPDDLIRDMADFGEFVQEEERWRISQEKWRNMSVLEKVKCFWNWFKSPNS